jgi:23S rRNA (guanosine2251-2'-O)-methyltransferase
MPKNRKLLNEELGRKSIEEFKKSKKIPVVLVLDNIRSALNVGSAFRTADAFLVEKIYLCGLTTTPEINLREIHKTALGSEASVDWEHVDDTVELVNKLKSQGFVIVSVEQAEKKVFLNDFEPETGKKYAFVFGNEVKGVDQRVVDNSDIVLEIPQMGHKHSFNISVSVGIVMWHYACKTRIFDEYGK